MKRRITTAAICAMTCIAVMGLGGCTPPPGEAEQAQVSESVVAEVVERSQALIEGLDQEAVELSKIEVVDAQDSLDEQASAMVLNSEAAADADVNSTVSVAPTAADFTVKDLRLEEEDRGEEDPYTSRYQYTVTGTLVNNGAGDASRVAFDVRTIRHLADKYGDDDPREQIVDNTVGLTPGTVGNSSYFSNSSLFNVKAGEEREFSLAFRSDEPCTDPALQITDVYSEADSNNDDSMFGYEEFDVSFGEDRCTAIKSEVNARIDRGMLIFAFVNSHGSWCEKFVSVSGVWPGETYEIVNNLGNPDEESNFTFLGMTYTVDEDATTSSFRDEFDVDYEGSTHVLKVTNNSGHYLSSMRISGSATYHTGNKGDFNGNAEYVAPGATVEFTPDGSPDDINIFDIVYSIDESKEEKAAR